MSAPKRRNDRGARKFGGFRPRRPGAPESGFEWLWGRHAVEAALANPRRDGFERLLLGPGKTVQATGGPTPESLDNGEISRLLPTGAVHQGYALLARPLEPVTIQAMATPASGVILMLDQVSDPQNIGAILRSAAAFGARGLVLQDRHAPALAGVLAKAAAGAVDVTPVARVVNLSRALEELSGLGWRSVGLDGAAGQTLDQVLDGSATVLVLGSEGEGLRRLVAEHCDATARIAMAGGFESLNVAAAAAVALHEAVRLAGSASRAP